MNFSVTQGTPFVVVGVNTNTATVGQTIGVHAVVSGFGSVPATGAVQFTDNGMPVGSSLPLQTGGFFGTQAQAATLLTNLHVGSTRNRRELFGERRRELHERGERRS